MKGWELGWNIEPLRESAATEARKQPALSQCLKDQHCAALILPEDKAVNKDWRIEPVVARPGTLLRGNGKNSGTPSLKNWLPQTSRPHAAAGCQGFYQEHSYSATSKVHKRRTKRQCPCRNTAVDPEQDYNFIIPCRAPNVLPQPSADIPLVKAFRDVRWVCLVLIHDSVLKWLRGIAKLVILKFQLLSCEEWLGTGFLIPGLLSNTRGKSQT